MTLLVRVLLLLFVMAVMVPLAGPPCVDVLELAEVAEASGEEDEASRVMLDGTAPTHRARPVPVRCDERSPPPPFQTQLFRPPRVAFV